MAEFLAKLRWIWIEYGGTAAAVLLTIAFAVVLIMALRKGGKGNA